MDGKMVDNIFESVKALCQISHTDDAYDTDIFMLTSGAIGTLSTVMDIMPDFVFTKESTWADLIGTMMATNPEYHNIKTYVCINVKTIFDPGNGPTVQYHERYLSQELFRIGLRFTNLKARLGDDVYKDEVIKRDDELRRKAANDTMKKLDRIRRGGV